MKTWKLTTACWQLREPVDVSWLITWPYLNTYNKSTIPTTLFTEINTNKSINQYWTTSFQLLHVYNWSNPRFSPAYMTYNTQEMNWTSECLGVDYLFIPLPNFNDYSSNTTHTMHQVILIPQFNTQPINSQPINSSGLNFDKFPNETFQYFIVQGKKFNQSWPIAPYLIKRSLPIKIEWLILSTAIDNYEMSTHVSNLGWFWLT